MKNKYETTTLEGVGSTVGLGETTRKFSVLYRSWYANLSAPPIRIYVEESDALAARDVVLRFNKGTVDVVSVFDVTPNNQGNRLAEGESSGTK